MNPKYVYPNPEGSREPNSIVTAPDRNPPLPLPERPNRKQIAHWLRDKAAFERSQYGGRQMDARQWAATCLTCAAEDLERSITPNEQAELEKPTNDFNGTSSEINQLRAALIAIDKLTCNCPCMSLQAEHEFARCKDAEQYRVSLAQVVLAIREQARSAIYNAS